MTAKRIKEASLELIAQRGYAETTLSLIAERVGIKKPSIYSHFQSKEDILFCILEDEAKNLNRYIESMFYDIKDCELEEMMYEVTYKFANYFNDNIILAKFWNMVMYFPPYSLEKELKFKFDIVKCKFHHYIKTNIEKKIDYKQFNEKNIMYAYEVMLRGIFTMIIYDGGFSIEKIDILFEIYFNGIKNKLN